MSVGVVVLSKASTPELAAVTRRMLDSLAQAALTTELDVLVIEQGEPCWPFQILHRADAFHFNRFANIGVRQVSGDHLLICNNDLVFHREAIDRLHQHAERSRSDVVCPLCPLNERQADLPYRPVEGTDVGRHFTGWCFLIRRDAWDTIGGFDEDFPFWYADNAVVEQLKRAGRSIVVLPSAVVEHRASATLMTLPRRQRLNLTRHQRAIFEAKYGTQSVSD